MNLDQFELPLQKEIKAKSSSISLKSGDVILSPGDLIKNIPIVVSGSIKVSRIDESGRELLLYYINPNESCSMTLTCCVENQKSEIKASAEEDSAILTIPIRFMNEWMDKFPTWKVFVMKNIQNRFDELLKVIDHIAFEKMDERLIHYLKEKSKTHHSPLLNISHQEIADDLATSREVISRLLKKLEIDKKLLLYRNQIKLLSEM